MFAFPAVVLPLPFRLILLDGVFHLPLSVKLALLPLSCVDLAVRVALLSEAVSLPCLELARVHFVIDFFEGALPMELVVEEIALVIGKRFLEDVPATPRKGAISKPTYEDGGRITSDPHSYAFAALRFVIILRELS